MQPGIPRRETAPSCHMTRRSSHHLHKSRGSWEHLLPYVLRAVLQRRQNAPRMQCDVKLPGSLIALPLGSAIEGLRSSKSSSRDYSDDPLESTPPFPGRGD